MLMVKLLKKYVRPTEIRYLFCGILSMLVSYITFGVALYILGTDKVLLANMIAFIVSTSFAFLTNKMFVFQSRERTALVLLRELTSFYAGRMFSFFVEESGLWISRDILHAGQIRLFGINGIIWAKLFFSGVSTIINYLVARFITFRKESVS